MAHILLAKDEASTSDFITALLRKAGHDVEVIHNGFEALSQIQDEDIHYDLLLTDIVLPGMDGVELVRRASDMRPDMHAMFITGFAAVSIARQQQPQSANQEAMKTRISKPFHLKELATNVDQLLAA